MYLIIYLKLSLDGVKREDSGEEEESSVARPRRPGALARLSLS